MHKQELFNVGDTVGWITGEAITNHGLKTGDNFRVEEVINITERNGCGDSHDASTEAMYLKKAVGHHQWLHISEKGRLISQAGKPIRFSGYWFKRITPEN